MASEDSPLPVFGYDLWDKDDNAEKIKFKTPLDKLLKGELSAHAAAYNINEILQNTTSERLRQLGAYAQSHDMTEEDREYLNWGDLPPPNAGAFAELVLDYVAILCPAFDPYTEGQNRLFAFLKALQDLPRWEGPETYPDAKGEVYTSTFWKFGLSWIGLEEAFSLQYHRVIPEDHHDAAARNRWRNFQHTMARLTADELVDCHRFSALHDITPGLLSELRCKFIKDYKITAAAQWLIYPHIREYVYRMCLKNEKITYGNNWKPWAKDRWRDWKIEFEFVAGSPLYGVETRLAAARALCAMKQAEAGEDGEEMCSALRLEIEAKIMEEASSGNDEEHARDSESGGLSELRRTLVWETSSTPCWEEYYSL